MHVTLRAVKDQYFGDARDYLKYHLLEALLAGVPGVERLVCLWMLTPPDGTQEGNVPFVERPELPRLTAFLRRHLESGDRRVSHMRAYFEEQGIEYTPWGDERPYFTNERRAAYFRNVPEAGLTNAVVFFDPDNGIATGRATPKHLTFQDIARVRDRMRGNSLAVIYQHAQRKSDFWETMATEIRRQLEAPVGYVAGPSVAYFVVPQNSTLIPSVDLVLQGVADSGRSRRVGQVRI